MDVVGDRTVMPNMTAVRVILVYASVITTVIMLVWMISEQEKIKSCTEKQDKQKVIVIQQPVNNQSRKEDLWDPNWDRKAWKDPKDSGGVPTRTMILVRHGQYDLQTGRLTSLGEQQANLTGRRLREMYSNYKHIIHSTLERAVQTATFIHQNLPHLAMISDDFIREGGPVAPQPPITYWGLPDRNEDFLGPIVPLDPENQDDYYVDGPRLEAAFRKHFHRADRSQAEQSRQILVGHGNIFRFFILRVLQFPKEAWMRFFIAHASITVIHIHPDGSVALDKMGDCGHLPVNMVTY